MFWMILSQVSRCTRDWGTLKSICLSWGHSKLTGYLCSQPELTMAELGL